jgi:hypothetical protein
LGRCDAPHHRVELCAIGGTYAIGFCLGDEVIYSARGERIR